MQLDKSQVLDLLRRQGDDAKAQRADQELPATVDTEQHGDILSELGLPPADLVAELDDGPEQDRTGLGSGAASGLGHSFTSEPEPLLGGGPTEGVDEDRTA